MLMTRKDCTTRFCVDYHKLNEVTRKDAYPLSRIDMTLDTCVDYAYPSPHTDMTLDTNSQIAVISTLNLVNGYWQVEVAEEGPSKTAFTQQRVFLSSRLYH